MMKGVGGAAATGGAASKKRHRVGISGRPSTVAAIDSSRLDGTISECSQRTPSLRRTPSHSHIPKSVRGSFNDPASADVVLRLFADWPFVDDDAGSISAVDSVDQPDVQIYLHSDVLRRSKYFATLLSERWLNESNDAADSGSPSKIIRLNLGVPMPGSIDDHVTVLQLLYTDDFSEAIDCVSKALSMLDVALKLIFDDCIKACVRFIEAVPWTEEEEQRIFNLIPLIGDLGIEESKELLVRVAPMKHDSSEDMLHGLILSAIHNHTNMASAKAFVAKLLRDFSSKELARRVLDRVFEASLKVMKESLEEYSSPAFRGDQDETEAIQKLNLHTAMTNGRHLLWLIERMIELRVADSAVKEWSNQSSFTADLQRAFRDDAWRNIVPGFPAVVLRCTCKLANAVAAGTILANRQVRMKLVNDWLPVLIVCKGNVSPPMPTHKTIYSELEETFLKIISTLPLPDAQDLLQKCLSFSTRNVEDCPHLIHAFTTWFRQANRSQNQKDTVGKTS
ncbi:hypothetical protein DM860_012786 [Cuscuta australis]|uniref:At3g05675-like ankyrin-like domain-containing protein n=1 Tax=Cuscuta australis TaxID=267555 RepID=A0A328DYV3_9ASTE|nr:hypothetical protein DM860_012786 [Cuscuta australis]